MCCPGRHLLQTPTGDRGGDPHSKITRRRLWTRRSARSVAHRLPETRRLEGDAGTEGIVQMVMRRSLTIASRLQAANRLGSGNKQNSHRRRTFVVQQIESQAVHRSGEREYYWQVDR